MGEISRTIGTLVEVAAKHSVDNDDGRIGLATANLVVAMKSDGLIEAGNAHTYQAIMEILVESGLLTLSPDSHKFVACRTRPPQQAM